MHAADAAPVTDVEAAALFADLVDFPSLLVAVSGGPDSTALMVLLARWRGNLRSGPDLLAATVDHGLRPEARREAAVVGELAARLGIPHRILTWRGEKPKTGLQEAARTARYRLLAQAARRSDIDHILTAHTRDDQAETVLFRLARGSGIAGLAGMARLAPVPDIGARGIMLVRPLLEVPKARLIATLERSGIAYADDPSNRDLSFTRARIRTSMPLLAAEGLDAAVLTRAAERARRADEALDWAAAQAMRQVAEDDLVGEERRVADVREFQAWPDEIALRVLGHHIAALGTEGPVELGKLEALLEDLRAAVDGGARRWRRTLAGAVVTLAGGQILVAPAPPRRSVQGSRPRPIRAAAAASRSGRAVRRGTVK